MLVKVFCWSVIFLLDHGLVNAMACIDLKFKLANLPMSGELWRPQRLHCNGQDSWLSLCHRNQNGENPFFFSDHRDCERNTVLTILYPGSGWRDSEEGGSSSLYKGIAQCSLKELLIRIEWSSFRDCQNCFPSHPLLPELCPFCLTTKCHDINKCRFRDK